MRGGSLKLLLHENRRGIKFEINRVNCWTVRYQNPATIVKMIFEEILGF